jgi:hypothetical protein
MERAIDEAVWRSFVHRDFSSLFRFLDFDSLVSGVDVNFRRFCADFTTGLMAAAHHGELRIVRRLLAAGAIVCLRDAHGRTAADFAREGAHAAVLQLLEDQLAMEMEFLSDQAAVRPAPAVSHGPGSGAAAGGADDEEMYDIYCLASTMDEATDGGAGAGGAGVDAAQIASTSTTAHVVVPGLDESSDDEDGWQAEGDTRCVCVCAARVTTPAASSLAALSPHTCTLPLPVCVWPSARRTLKTPIARTTPTATTRPMTPKATMTTTMTVAAAVTTLALRHDIAVVEASRQMPCTAAAAAAAMTTATDGLGRSETGFRRKNVHDAPSRLLGQECT